jgi:hypothetical protein
MEKEGETGGRRGRCNTRLLWLPALERVLAVELPFLPVVVVLLTEHRQRVRSDDVHRLRGRSGGGRGSGSEA